MKVYILIFLLITVQLVTPLTLDKIGEKVQAGIRIIKDKAITKLHKLKAEIELKKLHQIHATHFLPYAHKHYVQEHYSKKTPVIADPHQINKLAHYFEPHHHKIHYVPPPPVHHHYEHHHIRHH